MHILNYTFLSCSDVFPHRLSRWEKSWRIDLYSSFEKSGHNVFVKKSSAYEHCQSKKLLILYSPLVLMSKSGSGTPFVSKKSENVSAEISSAFRVWSSQAETR